MKTTYIFSFVLFMAFSGRALASGTHKLYNEYRPYTTSDVFISQSALYSTSNYSVGLRDKPSQSDTLDGYALRVAAGVEHMHYLHTSLFYSNVQENGMASVPIDYRANEFGSDVHLSFASPLVNFTLGGGAFVSRANVRIASNSTALNGYGYYASTELHYFVSQRLNLIFSAMRVVVKNTAKRDGSFITSGDGQGIRAGVGLNIWL